MWGGPIYGSAGLTIAYEHYLAYADIRILEQAYRMGKLWLEFLNSHVNNGMLTQYNTHGFFLGDWLGPGPREEFGGSTHALFFNNCVYAMNLELFCKIAELLGRDGETTVYRERLALLRAKVHETYYNPEISSYLDGNQVKTSFALYTGIFPDSLRPAALKRLEEDMTGAHPYFDIGSTSRYPYFKTLFAGRQFHEIIYTILSNTDYPGYGYLLSKGETTWPEIWEANDRTHFHTSYTGISAWFIKSLAGIEPDIAGAGYRTFNVCPNLIKKLSYVKAAIESPYGTIESGWRKEAGHTVYEITVPQGSKANICLTATASQTSEGGQPLERAQGITVLHEYNDQLVLCVEAGTYTFSVINNIPF
jgi:alpha-L-rhamnosidase